MKVLCTWSKFLSVFQGTQVQLKAKFRFLVLEIVRRRLPSDLHRGVCLMDVTMYWLKLMLHIPEVPGSNPSYVEG
jgi:hypothetical protein